MSYSSALWVRWDSVWASRSVFSLSNRRKQVSDLTSARRGIRFPKKTPYFNRLIVDAALLPDVPENSAHLPREPSRLKHLCCLTANIKINQAFLPVPPSGSSIRLECLHLFFTARSRRGAGGARRWRSFTPSGDTTVCFFLFFSFTAWKRRVVTWCVETLSADAVGSFGNDSLKSEVLELLHSSNLFFINLEKKLSWFNLTRQIMWIYVTRPDDWMKGDQSDFFTIIGCLLLVTCELRCVQLNCVQKSVRSRQTRIRPAALTVRPWKEQNAPLRTCCTRINKENG